MMRILFCGSGEFAVPSLRAIAQGPHELVDVITQPARRAGRGGKLRPTPVAIFSAEEGLDAQECPNINDDGWVARITAMRPDVICVADFGQLVREPVRKVAPLEAFNLHGSVLPALRGAAPVNWAIIRGNKTTGVTTFRLVDAMDAGPVYLTGETEIRPDETAAQLRQRLADLGAELVSRTLDLLASGKNEPIEQDHNAATLAPKLTKADGRLDFSVDAVSLRNRIHGTWPWPGGQAIFCRADGRNVPVTIARANVLEGNVGPGVLNGERYVGTSEGLLEIIEIKPAGGKLMSWQAFVNGYRAAPGDRFVSPEVAQ